MRLIRFNLLGLGFVVGGFVIGGVATYLISLLFSADFNDRVMSIFTGIAMLMLEVLFRSSHYAAIYYAKYRQEASGFFVLPTWLLGFIFILGGIFDWF